MLKERIANIWGRLTRKYRLVVYDHESLSQARAVIVKPLTLWLLGSGAVLVIAFLTGITLANFPAFQKTIPGLVMGNSSEHKLLQEKNHELERRVVEMDSMLKVFTNAIGGSRQNIAAANPDMYEALFDEELSVADPTNSLREVSEPAIEPAPNVNPVVAEPAKVAPKLSFRQKAEGILQRTPTAQSATSGQPATPGALVQSEIRPVKGPSTWNLIPPVDGYVTMDFNTGEKDHFGIDLVANENSLIRSVAEGVVIFSEYSTTTGYVIGIWHNDLNLISFYKHNSRLFKPVGAYVFAGEAIAVIGNTGINSSGVHLHFELWYDDNPVNPADFIIFN